MCSLNFSLGQTFNDYRSNNSNGTWSVASHWQVWNGSSWVTASFSPTNTNAQTITIRSGQTITVSASVTADQIVVDGSCTVNSGITLTIANISGTQLTVNGTVTNNGTITKGASPVIVFNSGSVYVHNQNGGTIPTAVWAATSTCRITGITTTDPTGDGQYFGNLVYDCPFIAFPSGNPNTYTSSFSIQGNFEVINTGNHFLYLAIPDGGTFNVGGNLVINDDFSLGGSNPNLRTINVAGNFIQTGGTLKRTNTADSYINFNGTGIQVFTFTGGFITENISFTVNSGSTLQMGTGNSPAIIPNTCYGSFTLSSGAGLIITSPQGITSSGTNGNIQLTGARFFSTGANYKYSGSSAQVTGNGLPVTAITGSITVENTSGVTPTNNLVISGTLTSNGLLTPASSQIINGTGTLNGSGTVNVTRTSSGSANFNSQYTITNKILNGLTISYQGSGSQSISSHTYSSLVINNSYGASLTGLVTVTDTLKLTTGKLTLDNYNLTVTGLISGGSSSSYIVTNGTGTLTRNSVGSGTDFLFPVGISTSYNPVTIKNTGTTDNFTVSVKTVFDNLPPDTSRVIKRQWIINEAIPGGSIAKLSFQFNSGEWGNMFSTSNPVHVGRWNGSAWVAYFAALSGSGPYVISNDVSNPVTSFLPFGVGSDGALPVGLSYFNTVINSRDVTLSWQTTWEINNSGFDVERRIVSDNGYSSWTKLSFIQGNGTKNESSDYCYTDKKLTSGSYQYRIKQIDYNGGFEYFSPSQTEAVIANPQKFEMSQNYPNPSNPKSKIDFLLPVSGDVSVIVYDMLGKEMVKLVHGYKDAGYHTVEFDGRNLASGVYIYKIEADNFTQSKKMILVK